MQISIEFVRTANIEHLLHLLLRQYPLRIKLLVITLRISRMQTYSSICSSSVGFCSSSQIISSSHLSSMTAWNARSSSTPLGGGVVTDSYRIISVRAHTTTTFKYVQPVPRHLITPTDHFQDRSTAHPLP